MFIHNADEGEKRETWLRSLKTGDVVAMNRIGTFGWERYVIDRITPGGRIKAHKEGANNKPTDFGPQGHIFGGVWGTSSCELLPWHDDFQKVMDRRKLENATLFYLERSVIDVGKVRALPDERLRELLTTLREFKLGKS